MGMTFTDIENKSAKRLIGIAAVIFLHLLVAYILMSGLANNIQNQQKNLWNYKLFRILSRLLHQNRKSRNQRKTTWATQNGRKSCQGSWTTKRSRESSNTSTKTTPVAQPTKVATPAPAAPSTPSPSPVAAPAPVAAAAPAPKPAGVTRGVSEGSAGCENQNIHAKHSWTKSKERCVYVFWLIHPAKSLMPK